MKFWKLLPIGLLLMRGDIASCKTNTNSEVRKELEGGYRSYRDAMMRRDTATIMAMLTPDFTWHMPDGSTLDREQTRAELQSYFSGVKRLEAMKVTVKKIEVTGNTATTLVMEQVTAVMQKAGTKSPRTVTTETYRETWEKTAEVWKIHRTQLLTSHKE